MSKMRGGFIGKIMFRLTFINTVFLAGHKKVGFYRENK